MKIVIPKNIMKYTLIIESIYNDLYQELYQDICKELDQEFLEKRLELFSSEAWDLFKKELTSMAESLEKIQNIRILMFILILF